MAKTGSVSYDSQTVIMCQLSFFPLNGLGELHTVLLQGSLMREVDFWVRVEKDGWRRKEGRKTSLGRAHYYLLFEYTLMTRGLVIKPQMMEMISDTACC